MKKQFYLTVLTLFSMLMSSGALNTAYATEPVKCGTPTGVGAVFYDIEKIILLVPDKAFKSEENNPSYPSFLKDENLRVHLEKVIRDGYSWCFGGSENVPIQNTTLLTPETYEDGVLTITFRVTYMPSHSDIPNLKDLGMYEVFLHRPDVHERDFYIVNSKHHIFQAFSPDTGWDHAEKTLDKFLTRIFPRKPSNKPSQRVF